VTPAAVALGMLDRLKTISPDNAILSPNQFQDFASFLDRRYRMRAFDSRTAMIDNIVALFSQLCPSPLADTTAVRIALELADQWNYAFGQIRESGAMVKLYPEVKHLFSYTGSTQCRKFWNEPFNDSDGFTEKELIDMPVGDIDSTIAIDNESTSQTTRYGTGVAAIWKKPSERYFQVNCEANVQGWLNREDSHSYANAQTHSSTSWSLRPAAEAVGIFQINWYPDTRTTLSFLNSGIYSRTYPQLDHSKPKDGLPGPLDSYGRSMIFRQELSCTYYVSPRLKYNLGASMNSSIYRTETTVISNSYESIGTMETGNSNFSIRGQVEYQIF
jgi:hypothetical protein